MFLGGLWHGANWTFVAWGLLHGAYLVAERILVAVFGAWAFWQTRIGRLVLMLATFVCVSVAWVFFRAQSFAQAGSLLGVMLGLGNGKASLALWGDDLILPLVAMTLLVGLHIAMRATTLEHVASKVPWWGRSLLLAVLCLTIITMPGEDRAFIYFQF